jgi:hypothetical protein
VFQALVERYSLTCEENQVYFERACKNKSFSILVYGFVHLGWNPNQAVQIEQRLLYPLDLVTRQNQCLVFMQFGARKGGDLKIQSEWILPTLTLIQLVANLNVSKDVFKYLRPFII